MAKTVRWPKPYELVVLFRFVLTAESSVFLSLKSRLVVQSSLSVRPDQKNDINANEYLDDPDVLDAKLDLFVALLQASKCAVAYTGAGLSKSSGIPDYASKAANSIASTFKTSECVCVCVCCRSERVVN